MPQRMLVDNHASHVSPRSSSDEPSIVTSSHPGSLTSSQFIGTLCSCVILEYVHSWGGEADKRSSSSPDTWPTFTAASHVTVLLREKAPFVSQRREGEGGLWGEPPLSSTTPPAIKNRKKEKKQGPDFPPLPSVLPTHSPLQHTNTGPSVEPLLRS
ncbi:hypothetical protein NQZ68_022775 [Dissostichus eleginoides]|nr:hypothetical protein NQZ68_022775 [Dissostichus eleginoides]